MNKCKKKTLSKAQRKLRRKKRQKTIEQWNQELDY